MALRIRTRFHQTAHRRQAPELAGVVAVVAWKIVAESVSRMRRADFKITTGHPYFEFVCEQLAFLAHCADRLAYGHPEAVERPAFLLALVEKLAEIVEDNAGMLNEPVAVGACRRHFVSLYNEASAIYAQYDYGPQGPDFGLRRALAERIRRLLPEQDRCWLPDQIIEIEVPTAIDYLNRTMTGLFSAQNN